MTIVCIALLSALRGLKPLAHLLNQLASLEYHLDTPHDSLPNFVPTYQGPTFNPIKHLKRRLVNFGMITIIIRELNHGNIHIPAPTKIQ